MPWFVLAQAQGEWGRGLQGVGWERGAGAPGSLRWWQRADMELGLCCFLGM